LMERAMAASGWLGGGGNGDDDGALGRRLCISCWDFVILALN
jgi:hypothetical protein